MFPLESQLKGKNGRIFSRYGQNYIKSDRISLNTAKNLEKVAVF